MTDQSFILFVRSNGWCIRAWPGAGNVPVELSLSAEAPPAEVAKTVATQLQSEGYARGAVAIAIPAAWCLSATIPLEGLSAGDAKAMLYRLEENLPLAAENIIADFVSDAAGETALGVCVRTDAIAPLVEALEKAGVVVQSIAPTALLIAQGLAKAITQSPCLLLIAEPGEAQPQINLIGVRDGQPVHWSLLPAVATDLKMQLDLLSTEFQSIPHMEAIDIDARLADELMEACSNVINLQDQAGSSVAGAFAAEVLQGRKKPWAEFRRDRLAVGDPLRLHRKWIDLSLVAGIALFVSLALVFVVRAHRYDRADKLSSGEMIAAFHEHFPGWETPVNVRAVVDAQYRRANGAGGADASARLARSSALITLHDVLVPMMAQDHFQIEKMAFHENSFEIEGRLQSYEQVDALSKLARAPGMVVSPAQTRRDADGSWTFALQGSRTLQSPAGERSSQD